MLTILVIFCPPFAVLLTASAGTAAKNFGLTMLLYFPGVLHARSVVEQYRVSRRYDSLMRLLEEREGGTKPRVRAA
jgi:uncharacterized membrane protein YqaE (UPF0057 family)